MYQRDAEAAEQCWRGTPWPTIGLPAEPIISLPHELLLTTSLAYEDSEYGACFRYEEHQQAAL